MIGSSARARAVCAGLLLAIAASGCSWILADEGLIQDRRNEYRAARMTTAPEIPEDLTGNNIRETMPVPRVPGVERYEEQEEFELPRPATLFAREEDRGVRIQRFSGESWIVVPDPPTNVWPRVKQYLSDNGVTIFSEDPEAGVMLSNGIELQEDDYTDLVRSALVDGRDTAPWQQLQLRVEQAVRRGATEVHVTQAGQTLPSGRPDFAAGSTDPQAESQLLGSLAEYLAAELGGAGISYVAQTIAAEPKAEIVRRSNEPPVLRLRLPFARAWATVATSLENAEILIEESDQATRLYRIRYNESQFRGEEPGWFARVFDFSSDDASAEGERFMLRLDEGSDGFELYVLDERERAVERETGEQILSVIREFAS